MWLILSLLLVQPADAGTSREQAETLFQTGIELYEQNDVDGAIAAFKGARGRGWTNSALEFNLGTAYMSRGDLGRAILHLERSAESSDVREAALHNLQIAREEADISHSPTALIKADTLLRQLLSPVIWFGLGFLFLTGVVCLAGIWIWNHRNSNLSRRLLVILSPVALLLLAVNLFLWSGTGLYDATVLEDIDLMQTTSPQAATIATGEEGALVRIVDTKDNWQLIQLMNGPRGWISVHAVERI